MVVHGYTWLYKVVKAAQGCTDKVVQGFTRFYKVVQGCTRLLNAIQGCTGL